MSKGSKDQVLEDALRKLVDGNDSIEVFAPPEGGFIKAMRKRKGMTGVDLAKELKVKPQSISAIERSENEGTIRLDTLRRVSKKLDCTLVYTLVPNEFLGKQRSMAPDQSLARAGAILQYYTDHGYFPEYVGIPDGPEDKR